MNELKLTSQLKKATDIIVKIEGFNFLHADYCPYSGHDNSVVPNIIMEHEGVGVVTVIGADITKLKIGDRVAIGCVTHCRHRVIEVQQINFERSWFFNGKKTLFYFVVLSN
ncbi:alcohol dehydrogenase catalytic domain-containing protein [Spiroplasma phoeniceum]|uniref:Alcohol dehydrogenase n=1 Tax=Spiroplasma phoeniceum P40 TaxID=1276259 RepID=A0A345DP94_9MOLU|nr:alcohol dehydrogenase catalytic domain-containing protein [Spiroplasma phoeniceum]AXF96032.1 alcohol dehydrogenase [Spiroplasma phoeniceum P40]